MLTPVWNSCQADGLGLRLFDGDSIAFVVYCDNLYVLAHSYEDFVVIYLRVQHALEAVHWRLPPDRITWSVNRHAGAVVNPWPGSDLVACAEPIRVLGVSLALHGGVSTCIRREAPQLGLVVLAKICGFIKVLHVNSVTD